VGNGPTKVSRLDKLPVFDVVWANVNFVGIYIDMTIYCYFKVSEPLRVRVPRVGRKIRIDNMLTSVPLVRSYSLPDPRIMLRSVETPFALLNGGISLKS
jgi:hypothetical protein